MKVESEFGFEPSLLIEMERVSQGHEAGAGWLHRAHILKDRTDTINGKAFDFKKPPKAYQAGDWAQTFKPFEPVFNALNIGGTHVSVDTTRTNDGVFDEQGDSEPTRRAKRVTIALEEIQGALVAIWPGQDAASKAMKTAAVETLFQTRSWTKVESLSLETLEDRLKQLRAYETELKDREKPTEVAAVVAGLTVCATPVAEVF